MMTTAMDPRWDAWHSGVSKFSEGLRPFVEAKLEKALMHKLSQRLSSSEKRAMRAFAYRSFWSLVLTSGPEAGLKERYEVAKDIIGNFYNLVVHDGKMSHDEIVVMAKEVADRESSYITQVMSFTAAQQFCKRFSESPEIVFAEETNKRAFFRENNFLPVFDSEGSRVWLTEHLLMEVFLSPEDADDALAEYRATVSTSEADALWMPLIVWDVQLWRWRNEKILEQQAEHNV